MLTRFDNAPVAQFERSLIIERNKSGLNAARAIGRVGGRKPKMLPEDVKKARALALSNEITMGEIAEHFKVSRTTLYKYLGTNKD